MPGVVLDGRNRKRDIQHFSVVGDPLRFEMLNSFAGSKFAQDGSFLGMQVGRDQRENRLADDFFRSIPEQSFRR